jgi:lipopolysaccharide/colanic/teichoic acid biosynthesis glycosyltransferase
MRDFDEIVMLETSYVRNWSILSDFAILLRTIPAVFGMRGAH